MKTFDGSIRAVRLALIEIGWRRAMREIKRRGYSVPDGVLRDGEGVLGRSCNTNFPGLLPGFTMPECQEERKPKGFCYAAAEWTGEWSVWGWDAEGKYWQLDRKVRRSEAMAEMVRKYEEATHA